MPQIVLCLFLIQKIIHFIIHTNDENRNKMQSDFILLVFLHFPVKLITLFKIFFDDPPPISFRDCLTLSNQEKRHALAIIHHSNSFLSVACVLMELKAISNKNELTLQLIILGIQFKLILGLQECLSNMKYLRQFLLHTFSH